MGDVDRDLVLAEDGHRPPDLLFEPDSRTARAAHLVTRIDWDAEVSSYLLTLLEQAANDLAKGKKES